MGLFFANEHHTAADILADKVGQTFLDHGRLVAADPLLGRGQPRGAADEGHVTMAKGQQVAGGILAGRGIVDDDLGGLETAGGEGDDFWCPAGRPPSPHEPAERCRGRRRCRCRRTRSLRPGAHAARGTSYSPAPGHGSHSPAS